jgi:SAM-dependent methyltransferase
MENGGIPPRKNPAPRGASGRVRDGFRSFWESVGDDIPPFSGSPSTRYYAECEQYLLDRYFPRLRGKALFKTDLWDEAKNTRILYWAAAAGARTYGLDISFSIAGQARDYFVARGAPAPFIVSDIRRAAFRDGSFDHIYSMGTVEHSPDFRRGIEECFRLLKPGGTAIIGVPNKLDPFLRPLQVTILNALGLYAYGYERSFTRGQLERMLRKAGFEVTARTGILFMPGWLRMLDLFLFVIRPSWSASLRPLIAPFAWLYRRFESTRRCGYLIASVARKPGGARPAGRPFARRRGL